MEIIIWLLVIAACIYFLPAILGILGIAFGLVLTASMLAFTAVASVGYFLVSVVTGIWDKLTGR